MKRNEDHLITGPYEVGTLLQQIVKHYDTYAGTINDADLRSLNYATERLNTRARLEGIPAAVLHYKK